MGSYVLSKDQFAEIIGLVRKTFYFFIPCDVYVSGEKNLLKVDEIFLKDLKFTLVIVLDLLIVFVVYVEY